MFWEKDRKKGNCNNPDQRHPEPCLEPLHKGIRKQKAKSTGYVPLDGVYAIPEPLGHIRLCPVRKDEDTYHRGHIDDLMPEWKGRLFGRHCHLDLLFFCLLVPENKRHHENDHVCKTDRTNSPCKPYLPAQDLCGKNNG